MNGEGDGRVCQKEHCLSHTYVVRPFLPRPYLPWPWLALALPTKTQNFPWGRGTCTLRSWGSIKPHSGLSNSPQANRWYSPYTQLSWSHVWGNLEERQGYRACAQPQAKYLALNRCLSDPLDEEKAKKLFSQKHKAYSYLSGIACGSPHLLGHTCNQGHES